MDMWFKMGAIYYLVIGILVWTDMIVITPFSAGMICMIASLGLWNLSNEID